MFLVIFCDALLSGSGAAMIRGLSVPRRRGSALGGCAWPWFEEIPSWSLFAAVSLAFNAMVFQVGACGLMRMLSMLNSTSIFASISDSSENFSASAPSP